MLQGAGDLAEKADDKLPNIYLTPFLKTDFVLDAYQNVSRPVGEWLDDEEKLQAAANLGIVVNTTGADFLTRLKAGFGSRQLSFEDSVKLLTSVVEAIVVFAAIPVPLTFIQAFIIGNAALIS